MSRVLNLEEDDLLIIYLSLCCLESNKFVNKFKKKKIDELKQRVRPSNADQSEFGIPLLNEKDFNN